jgi:adenylate cyclase
MRFRIFYIIGLFLLFFNSCNFLHFDFAEHRLQAQKGILDLRTWDFEKNGPVKLDGEWEFYWEKLYSLEEITGIFLNKTYFTIPHTWNDTIVDGNRLDAEGYATFRLRILLPDNSPALAIRSQQQATAFHIFVNGNSTLGSGKVGISELDSIPHTVPAIGYVPDLKMQDMEVVMQISNYHHRKGGTWHSIFLGTYRQISTIEKTARETDSFLAGLLLFIFVYHLGFYQLRKNDKSSILFSLFFLLLFLRIVTTGEKLITNYPLLNQFEVYVRLEYLVFFLSPALAIQFLHYLFPKEIHKLFFLTYYVIGILASFSLLLKPVYFTYAFPILQPALIVSLILIPYYIIKAVINKREYAVSILVSTIAIILTNAHDLLAINEVIHTNMFLIPYGIVIMALTQSYTLLLKFSSAFKRIEELSLDLRRTNFAYARFVPYELILYLKKESILEVQLGNQIQREMTILFSDIRSFTQLSETMTPEENFNFLNAYLKRMNPCVQYHSGFIDKYIGDGLMALYPLSPDDAIESAIEMQKEIRIYNQSRLQKNFAPIEIGIGIHTGMIMLGTIGTEDRMEGTVISDAVNLASRIEGLTKIYGASILMSIETLFSLEDADKYLYRILDRVKVKGKEKNLTVVEILNGHSIAVFDLFKATKTQFEMGVSLYLTQDFHEAISCFTEIVSINPHDKAAELYLKRCSYYEVHGVPLDWEGVSSFDDK